MKRVCAKTNALRYSKILFSTVLLLSSPFLFWNTAEAKNLHGKLGFGYNAQFASTGSNSGIPGLSLKYGLTSDLASELVFGVSTSSPGSLVVGLKFFKNIFYETNLNFYFAAGAGIISATGSTAFEILGTFGSEFFFPGLESLGFSIEMGVALSNASGSFAVQTIGHSFVNAGIRFYF